MKISVAWSYFAIQAAYPVEKTFENISKNNIKLKYYHKYYLFKTGSLVILYHVFEDNLDRI